MRWAALQWLGLVVMAAGFARLDLWAGAVGARRGMILIAGVAAELGAARH